MSAVQFRVGIKLKRFKMTGYRGLDIRRKYGLEEKTLFEVGFDSGHYVYYPVSEAFAREFFEPEMDSMTFEIPYTWLVPGELAANHERMGTVNIVPGLSEERIKALWVRADLHSKINELEEEIEDLKGQLSRLPA